MYSSKRINMKEINKIKEQIDKKELELSILRKELNDNGKRKYYYLIGKFYKLSATEMIKITDVNYIDHIGINFKCIRIYSNDNIEIILDDNYKLFFVDIEEKRITEVSKEMFIEFMYSSFDQTSKIINEII